MANFNDIGSKRKNFSFQPEEMKNPFLKGNISDNQIKDSVEKMTDFMGYLSAPIENNSDPKIPALVELGFYGFDFDSQKFKSNTMEESKRLQDLGYEGRLYTEIPLKVSTGALAHLIEEIRQKDVDEAYFNETLYGKKTVVSRTPSSLLMKRHKGKDMKTQTRLMMFNVNQNTNVDPALLALNQPFDDYARDKWGQPGDQTQQEFFNIVQQNLKSGAWDLMPGNLRSFMSVVGQDRYAETNVRNQLFAKGWARLLDFKRGEVAGLGNFVPYIISADGRIESCLGSSNAHSDNGVFISIGINK